MANSHDRNKGAHFQIQGCQLWAEIDYLDSPTDYRECLQESMSPPRSAPQSELILLDGHTLPWKISAERSRLLWVGLSLTLINLLVLGYLLHLFIDVF